MNCPEPIAVSCESDLRLDRVSAMPCSTARAIQYCRSDIKNLTKETLEKQYELVKLRTSNNGTYNQGSHVMQFGDLIIDEEPAADYLGKLNTGEQSAVFKAQIARGTLVLCSLEEQPSLCCLFCAGDAQLTSAESRSSSASGWLQTRQSCEARI